MADDQVGAEFPMLAAGLENTLRMAHGVLEGPRAVVRLLRGPALQLILDQGNAPSLLPGGLRAETSTLPAVISDQPAGDMAELGGKVLVDEQDVHGWDSQKDGRGIIFAAHSTPGRPRVVLRIRVLLHIYIPGSAARPRFSRRLISGILVIILLAGLPLKRAGRNNCLSCRSFGAPEGWHPCVRRMVCWLRVPARRRAESDDRPSHGWR